MSHTDAASEDFAESTWQLRCDVLYKAMVGYRYHRKRQRFFDLVDKWTKALTVIGGGSLLADPLKAALPFVAIGISAIGLLSLVFGYSDRKQAHKELAEAFANAISRIEGVASAELASPQVATWHAEVTAINAKEPPQLSALVSICEREQSIANGFPDHIAKLPLYKRISADWISFG